MTHCWRISQLFCKEEIGLLIAVAERFLDVVRDVGFQVNYDVLSALTLRQMRKDGTLDTTFRRFLVGCLSLHRRMWYHYRGRRF
ncbi:hypothetical protein OUZ56_027871 [Daphnia magna]|uniref:Uncharacterized protein n=1 Tax=Daphnia magna TaxID=35525 RepID=A0ABR0B263_9CRUS|nr:hypothetical protein OUZ56_027871 [Daphnia magna]